MEIENDFSSENLRDTIINQDNYHVLDDINSKTEQYLRVCVDMKNNSIINDKQLFFSHAMQDLFKAEIIDMNGGIIKREQENIKEEQGDWIYFINGIGQSTRTLEISIEDQALNSSNLDQFRQELLRLNHLEKFHLQIGKEKIFGVAEFTQLGEALRRMTQLQDLSIIIGEDCLLGVNGSKGLFYGMEACEKIEKLRIHIGSNNCLKAEGTQIISAVVCQLKRVNDFDLLIGNTNNIGNEGMQFITNIILKQDLKQSAKKLSLIIDDMIANKTENIVEIFSSIQGFKNLKNLYVDLWVKKKTKEDSIKIIQDSIKKLKSLLTIWKDINKEWFLHYLTPKESLLSRFQFSDNVMSLQLAIPPHNQFNNAALSLLAVSLKTFQQLQVFSLEIQENNLKGNTTLNRKVPASNNNNDRKMNYETIKQQEVISQPRGIRDISESLSSLKKLEKVEWIISHKNDVSDGGWEMLSRSQSLREFRVSIGQQCRFQDEGLHSLSKICSNMSLDCLRIKVHYSNKTSEGGWSNLFRSINFEKMKDFKIFVDYLNECSDKSLGQLAVQFERISPPIEYLTLDFQESNNITSDSIQQLANSLKQMLYLKQLTFKMSEYLEVNRSALNSLSDSLEKMSDLIDLRIFFNMQDDVELLDEIKLCSVICSLRKLRDLNLSIEGNGLFLGNSIFQKLDSFKFPITLWKNLLILEFRTENGLQFQKEFTSQYFSQERVQKLADSLALSVFALEKMVYLRIQVNPMEQAENCPQFTQIISFLSEFKKCIKLKLDIYYKFFSEFSLNQLTNSIACMPFLSKLSLRLDSQILPLNAAETLAAFFENSHRISKVRLICKSNPDIDQSQAQLLLMNSILTSSNLRSFQVFFESFSKIQFDFKNQQKIENLPFVSSMQEEGEKILDVSPDEGNKIVEKTNENVPLKEYVFYFTMEERIKPTTDEVLINLGQFLMSKILLQTIKLQVSSALYISTEIASSIQEGIMNQANLTDLHLEFTGSCFVSGQGAVLLSQSYSNQKNKNRQTIKIQTDDTFSIYYALVTLISFLGGQGQQINKDYLKITGTKFIITTDLLTSNATTILNINCPNHIALCKGIRLDQFEAIQLSQIADKLSELKSVSDLYFNASENFQKTNQDWSSFRQLSFITWVSIKDKSSITSSRFLSLESSLSHMTHLKSLTLNLSHIHENLSSQETIIVPFGKCLNNLKEVTEFKITFQDFNFGEDGVQPLGYGIEGMIDLKKFEIECINPQNLQTEGIKSLCEVISKSPQIQQLDFSFYGLLPSLEIPFFTYLKNQLWNQKKSLQKYSINVNGDINQAFGSIQRHSTTTTSHIVLNQGTNHIYELNLPSKYCFEPAFENEAINKCTDILQVFYSFNNDIYSIQNASISFDFTKPKYIEPNLIFLKSLISVLCQEQRRIKSLLIEIVLSQNGQFQFIFESALKDIKLVDTLSLNLGNVHKYKYSIQQFYSITSLDTLTNLKIKIRKDFQNQKQFRQRIIRKMKRLCNYESYY